MTATPPQTSELNEADVQWMAKLIYTEARGESSQGQISVGAVIMNRVKSDLFPNTVEEVIFEQNNGHIQFSPAESGAWVRSRTISTTIGNRVFAY